MTSYIANRVAKGALSKHAAQLEPQDPHYETFVDNRGKTRSRKRAMPVGLSKRDERILLGLIPIAGDLAAFLLGYMLVLKKCREADLPLVLQQRMAFNQAVSVGAGMIPMVGDIILAVWKANSRNAALLEEYLIARASAPAPEAGGPSSNRISAQLDEAAAQKALNAPGIDKATGDRVGGTAYQISEDQGNASGVASTSAAPSGKSSGKKTWYGWGGSAEPGTKN
ncbi:hypothetical protein P7C70_g6652, partial [Phenoliferia sp. Uapishka_3]